MCWYFIKEGSMGLADGMFVYVAGRTIARTFNILMEELVAFSEEKAKVVHAYDDIILPCSIVDAVGAKNMKAVKGQIVFEDVSFNYGEKDIIKHFNLLVKPHEKVGIVGLSGAGKTTLVNLILRAYDVKSGAIKFDNYDIRDVKQDSLHKNISFVPQEAVLFNRTLLDNIRYARPQASRQDVIEAAKKANIHSFIQKLPTLVGNRGIKLSGGQRQRVAIARAILKNSPVLILDEATSALDSENELLIQKSLKTVMRGRTTIAIAHRLSTLRNMDRIIVLDKGRIIESGTHAQLLRLGGEYRKLWNMQTGGFVGE
ncbi:MAG: ATP-binding cassette domain-containing protein [Alphaproteobacteria bacterium]|nr:ATP-binding cassette domain-containing protein [Alphaproteobacteria bacterium]